MPLVDDPPIGRRIRAAMAFAGISGFGELASLIDQRGLRERTLRKLADDNDASRDVQRRDILAIADATGLPYEFFTLPRAELLEAVERAADERGEAGLGDRIGVLEQQMVTVLGVLTRRAAEDAASAALPQEGREGPAGRREQGRSA